ncbi:MAG: 4a-hydroxytetrahydrobiopterin dehydratase [Ignavibacterium sp.]|nr:4a-hydroxytetrahydrobiopterin dehydratase [Ignavibacterium sp.]MCX7612228.1 4a-hydroxytetrahydrobiopterin dehydratase [Ignavibacterium sp.]MDW8374317.1 4a-hydroxytetrahydrobiopterin dehydratase [Ignavibacteriales bacterium]
MSVLSKEEIQENLQNLNGWSFSDNQIEKTYQFKDFIDAFSFVSSVAFESEKLDHHPDIFLHSWNKVKISISTHSVGGVTSKDFQLANLIEKRLNK